MYVIILSAGRGNRFNNDVPKCLLDVGNNETILDRQIRILLECGISFDEIFVIVGYGAEKIPKKYNLIKNEYYDSTDNSYSLTIGLKHLINLGVSKDILVLDGDLVFTKETILPLIEQSGNLMLVSPNYVPGGVGVIVKNSRIIEIGKHLVDAHITYDSIMKISWEPANYLLKYLDNGNKRNWYVVPINSILSKFEFKAISSDNQVFDINCEVDYLNLQSFLNEKHNVIMITGASGFLGNKIYTILNRTHSVIGTSSRGILPFKKLDLSNIDEVYSFINLNKPDVVIHTSAISDPDYCEEHKKEAFEVNVMYTYNLCEVCKKNNVKLIFISTDYVFDGKTKKLYETDATRSPCNYYGHMKVLAEDCVLSSESNLIIRIPIIYGYNGDHDKVTFVLQVLSDLRDGIYKQYDDSQIRFPVLTDDVAESVLKLLNYTGIVQITSDIGITKYEWAIKIAQTFNYSSALIGRYNADISNRPMYVKMKMDDSYASILNIKNIDDGLSTLKNQINCVFRLIYKGTGAERIFNTNVGVFRYELGRRLSKYIPDSILNNADAIVPVPSSGMYYAMGLSFETKIPYIQALVKSEYSTRSFNVRDENKRKKIINSKITPIPEFIRGKNIIVVDEAIFTGVTLRLVCDMLKACECKSISICIPSPVCYNACSENVQPNRILITEYTDDSDLVNYFSVDNLIYMPYHEFNEALGSLADVLCKKCFQPDYENDDM